MDVIGDVNATRRRCAVAHNAASLTSCWCSGAGEMRKPGSVVMVKVADGVCLDASRSQGAACWCFGASLWCSVLVLLSWTV